MLVFLIKKISHKCFSYLISRNSFVDDEIFTRMHFNAVLTLKKTIRNMLDQQRRQKRELNFTHGGK